MVERIAKDALYEKFNNVMTRPGRGGSYQYIKWQDVADRMNVVFGTNWASSIESQDIIGNNIVVRVRVMITDPYTKEKQWQEGFGGAQLDDRQEPGNPHKSAYSKALKDACKKWGVGLYIDEEEDIDTAQGSTSGSYGGSSNMPAPSMPPNKVSNQQAAAPKFSAPPMHSAPPSPPQPTSSGDAFPPKAASIGTAGAQRISDVQKAALNGILSLKGVDYETLVKEALSASGTTIDTVVSIDDLSYQDAVTIIKYGNDKFRKR